MIKKELNILIYGGTTEGRQLAEKLCSSGYHCTVCVATGYGECAMNRAAGLTIHQGRMNQEQMKRLAEEEDFLAVVDATHPYATEVSRNIRGSMKDLNLPYIRLKRNTGFELTDQEGIFQFTGVKECVKALEDTRGNILLTTGSKELSSFCTGKLKERLYVRILPGMESLRLCEEQGIQGKQIIAMQGPFSTEMNRAVMKQFQITCLVTKQSGSQGGFYEKIKASLDNGTAVYIIDNPETEETPLLKHPGYSFLEVLSKIYQLSGEPLPCKKKQLYLIGMGMGRKELLTEEVREALRQAEVVFGAPRLLEAIEGKEKYPFYTAGEILPKWETCIEEGKEMEKTAVLFSGDIGFHSGAQKLLKELRQAFEEKGTEVSFKLFPGISSMSYLAAGAGISYQDAFVVSTHGRKADVAAAVKQNKKVFLISSGVFDLKHTAEQLIIKGLVRVDILVGYQLSYPDEEIKRMTPVELRELTKEGLYCCFIENERAGKQVITHGIEDKYFLRAKVPMTKEEIREISICKLKLTRNAVLYDIGSGTGSIAVECALLSPDISVYAIERNPEAVTLIRENCEKFGTENVALVPLKAPDCLADLPVPTHAFIGGSGGNMKEILTQLYHRNKELTVVVTAVTLETVSSMTELLKEFATSRQEIVQVQVSRAGMAGCYHLMRAENPVTIITFQFRKETEA